MRFLQSNIFCVVRSFSTIWELVSWLQNFSEVSQANDHRSIIFSKSLMPSRSSSNYFQHSDNCFHDFRILLKTQSVSIVVLQFFPNLTNLHFHPKIIFNHSTICFKTSEFFSSLSGHGSSFHYFSQVFQTFILVKLLLRFWEFVS
jgi:hypothetical protein